MGHRPAIACLASHARADRSSPRRACNQALRLDKGGTPSPRCIPPGEDRGSAPRTPGETRQAASEEALGGPPQEERQAAATLPFCGVRTHTPASKVLPLGKAPRGDVAASRIGGLSPVSLALALAPVAAGRLGAGIRRG